MRTAWTTSVALAIAMGGLFFATDAFRMSEATPPVAQHEGVEIALQKITALQTRVEELQAGNSCCIRFAR